MIALKHNFKPFAPVDFDALPEYPRDLVDAGPSADHFIRLFHHRWLNSALHLRASMRVQGMALNLFMFARQQNPLGSLPNDRDMLARLLRVSPGEWSDALTEAPGPLHGWRQYRGPQGVVLGHAVVIEEALDSLARRAEREMSRTSRAEAARLTRLREVVTDMGRDYARVYDAADKLAALDAWLTEHHRGRRVRPQLDSSIARGTDALVRGGVL